MKTKEELSAMSVIELRNLSKEFGIKNVKSYKKVELVEKIFDAQLSKEEAIVEPAIEEVVTPEEVTVPEEMVNEEVADVVPEATSCKRHSRVSKSDKFYAFVERYKGSLDTSKIEEEGKATLSFSKEEWEEAVKDYTKHNGYRTQYYHIDNYLHNIVLIARPKRRLTREGRHLEKPIGEQSLRIYNMMVEHPTWTHYKIRSIVGCTYTNVRRVYTNYIKGTDHDKRK